MWQLVVVGTVPSLECLSTRDGYAANLALLTFNVSESDRQKLPAAQTSSLALVAALSHSFADNSTPCEHDPFQTTQIQVCPWFIITMKSKLPCFMGYPHISSIYPHISCPQPYQFVFLHSESTLHWPQLTQGESALGSHVDQPPWRTAGDPGPGRWVAGWPGGHGSKVGKSLKSLKSLRHGCTL